MNWTYYTNNNYSIVPDDDFYSGCWNISHYYRQQSFSRQFWYYQLSWQRTLATVESFKADVSSVNPSSERSRELSCYTLPPTQLNRFFINLPPSQEYPHPDDWTTRSNLQPQMPFESDVRERFCWGLLLQIVIDFEEENLKTPKKQIGLPLFGRLMLLITQRMITDRIKHAKMTRSSWSIS